MIQDNLLVIGLLLTFVLISWFTYKSLNSSTELEEDDVFIPIMPSDDTFIEDPEFNGLVDFSQFQNTEVEEQKNEKLSEKLKTVRPAIALDIETPTLPSAPSKPVTKNIRVNKKIKN